MGGLGLCGGYGLAGGLGLSSNRWPVGVFCLWIGLDWLGLRGFVGNLFFFGVFGVEMEISWAGFPFLGESREQ